MNLQEKIQERMRRKALAKAWNEAADVITDELEDEAREWLARTGTRPTWSVQEVADVVLPLSHTRVVIEDIRSLTKWTKETVPDNIQEEVRPTFQAWLLKNARITADGAVVHPDTNEVIPGLKVQRGGVPGSLRFTADSTAEALLVNYARSEVARLIQEDQGEATQNQPQESSVSDPDGA